MVREYFLISATAMALLLTKNPTWVAPTPIHTTHGVDVYDSRYIDSLQLRGWDDLTVQYPINLNDSNDVHIVYLNDSEIVP